MSNVYSISYYRRQHALSTEQKLELLSRIIERQEQQIEELQEKVDSYGKSDINK